MNKPVNLEEHLSRVTAGMTRFGAYEFVLRSLPTASDCWIARIIGCHCSTVQRYRVAMGKEWRCQKRSRKRYERKPTT